MTRLSESITGVLLIGSLLALTACSSGGDGDGNGGDPGSPGDGGQALATLNSDNTEVISRSATDVLPSAIGNETEVLLPSVDLSQLITGIAASAANTQQANNLPAGIIFTSDQINTELNSNDLCGGSVEVPDDAAVTNGIVETTVTFNDLCFNDTITPQTITMNGDLQVTISSVNVTLVFLDFTVITSSDGRTHTITDTTVACNLESGSCTAEYNGNDGNNYDVADLEVSGDNNEGYFVSATFTHPDIGAVEMMTEEPLFFTCIAQRHPSDGRIAFTGGDNTGGSIEFLDCSSFSYCYDDNVTDTTEAMCQTGSW